MGYRATREAEKRLTAILEKFVPAEHVEEMVDAVKDIAEAMASDALDRHNGTGDYGY